MGTALEYSKHFLGNTQLSLRNLLQAIEHQRSGDIKTAAVTLRHELLKSTQVGHWELGLVTRLLLYVGLLNLVCVDTGELGWTEEKGGVAVRAILRGSWGVSTHPAWGIKWQCRVDFHLVILDKSLDIM